MIPDSCWRGVFGVYKDAVADTTEAPEDFHYISLMCVLGTLLGRSVYTYYAKNLYPNLYVVLVGESEQTKKTTSMRHAMSIYNALRSRFDARLISGISSAEGLIRALGESPVIDEEIDMEILIEGKPSLLTTEEFATLLRKSRQESLSNLTPMITSIYDTPDEISLPTRKRPLRVVNPFLSILGGTTPDWMQSSLKIEEIMGGFVNRFIFMTGEPKNPIPFPDKPRTEPVIKYIAGALDHWNGKQTYIPLDKEAKKLWEDFYRWWRRVRAGVSGIASSTTSRVTEHIQKMSLIYAAMDRSDYITREHLRMAIELGKYILKITTKLFANWPLSDSAKTESKILDILKETNPISRGELYRRLSGRVQANILSAILHGLASSDKIKLYRQENTSYIELI